jgi:hypothetical protein
MAPIGPGFAVGAIFAFENNTLSEFAAAGRGGLAAALYATGPEWKSACEARRAQLLNSSESSRRRSRSHPSAARPSTAGWRKTVARLGLLPEGDGRSRVYVVICD